MFSEQPAGREPSHERGRVDSSHPFVGCTTATAGFLPGARVLARSWRRHHPESPFFVLLADADESVAGDSELFEVIRPGELGIAPDELAVQRGIYDAGEFSTALKPHLLRHLLDRGASSVVFSDADTDVYAGLEDVAAAATAHGLALTPHVVSPIAGDGMTPTQIEYQQIDSGIFNTGLLSVADGGRTFLAWWASRLARDCLSERRSGMWVDQRWTDWVPAYFDHMVLRDTSLNVAFWNLHERPLEDLAGKPCVDGAPLRHFHFSGLDPQRARFLSTYLQVFSPRPFKIAYRGTLGRLLADYGQRLMECGYEELHGRAYRYDASASGRPLRRRERTIYREAVLAAEARDADPPPNPFDPDRTEEFERMIDDPAWLRSLSPEAQTRLELVRPPGLGFSSWARFSRRLASAARYALTEQRPAGVDVRGRVASDIVRLEY